MQKHTIFGLPLNPMPLLDELKGSSFCVSYATRDKLGKQLNQAIELVGADQILLVDNGAWSHHQSGGTMDEAYIEGYEAWAENILVRCPQAIAVYPDIIGGDELANKELIQTSLLPFERTMPIWHMHESIEYLLWMVESGWDYIGFGSTCDKPGSVKWRARIKQAMDAIDAFCADSDGAYIRPRIHMMRAQNYAHQYGFDSSDSTNVAVNHGREVRKLQKYATVGDFAKHVDSRIQASAGSAVEHQIKRPLLGHVEWTAWRDAFWRELRTERAVQIYYQPAA